MSVSGVSSEAVAPADVRLAFPKEEFIARRDRVVAEMQARGLDLLLVSTPPNFYYLTGIFTGLISNFVFKLAITAKGDGIWIGRHTEMSNVRARAAGSWATETRSILDSMDPYEELARQVKSLVGSGSRVGIDYASMCLSVAGFERLKANAPHVDFVDASGLVEKFRAIKSAGELDYLRRAGAISGAAIRTALGNIRAGHTDRDIASDLFSTAVKLGSEPMSMGPFVPTGLRTFQAHSSWIGAELRPGDLINTELAAVVARYNTPVFRVAVVGEPSDELKRFYDASRAGLEAGLSGIEPGMTSHDADAVVRAAIERTPYAEYFTVRAAYGIGIGMQPTWAESAVLAFRPNDRTVIRPGMTVHIVPALYKQDIGCVCCSMPVEVTDSGVHPLTDISPDLIVVNL